MLGTKETFDGLVWKCHTQVDKFWGDPTLEERESGLVVPYDSLSVEGNTLVYAGSSVQWQTLIGNGVATAGQTLTFFNNANAAIGVGDSTTNTTPAAYTNLQGAVNNTDRVRVGMDATYPLHTPGTTIGAQTITFRSTFGTSVANFAWNEWGVFNSVTDGTGSMLNRKVESLGTKTNAATWVLTVTLTLS